MDGNYGIYLLLQGVLTSAAKEAKIFSTFSIKKKRSFPIKKFVSSCFILFLIQFLAKFEDISEDILLNYLLVVVVLTNTYFFLA